MLIIWLYKAIALKINMQGVGEWFIGLSRRVVYGSLGELMMVLF
jgi:hypothetical protein